MGFAALPVSVDDTFLSQVPDKLRTLIGDGAGKLYGDGSVRYTALSGHHPGSFAGHIQPVGDVAGSSFSQAFQGLGAGVQALQSFMPMMMGLQVVNLAVSVAGFAIVCHKLNRIEAKIDSIADNVNTLTQEVKRLGMETQDGFSRVHSHINRNLLAEARGQIDGLGQVLRAGKHLDGSVIVMLSGTRAKADAEFVESLNASCYGRALDMLSCSSNISIALALAWACDDKWVQCSETINGAAKEGSVRADQLVRHLMGGWPTIYVAQRTDDPFYESKFVSAAQTLVPATASADVLGWIKRRYPIRNDARCLEVGDVGIPVPLQSNAGVYVRAPHLGNDEYWNLFVNGRKNTVEMAAKAAAIAMSLERMKHIFERQINPLQISGTRIAGELEYVEVN